MACNLTGKTCIITGAARSGCIGQGIAKVLAQNGAQLILIDILPIDLTTVSPEVRAATLKTIQCDQSKEKEIESAIKTIRDMRCTVDVLINNAAIVLSGQLITETSADDWQHSYMVNVRGYALMMKHVIPIMTKDSGSIINIASIGGMKAIVPGSSIYYSTKAAIIQLTKNAALDIWEKYRIRVNAVCPGPVMTTLLGEWAQREVNEGRFQTVDECFGALCKIQMISRLAKPQDIGKACLFFASELSTHCTGTQLNVDGGMAAL